MLTDIQREKIIKVIEKELGVNITKNLFLTSKYGLKRFSNRRVFSIETQKGKFIVEITRREQALLKERIYSNKLSEYYPKIILQKRIKIGEVFNIIVSEFISDKKISDILNNDEISTMDKKVLIDSVLAFLTKKNNILGKVVTRKYLEKELNEVVEEFSVKYIIDQEVLKNIKKITKGLIDEIPSELYIKRPVNFDFIPSNILLNKQNRIKIIDLEYIRESTLIFIEPFRFIYYLVYDEYFLLKEENPNISSFYFEYVVINLLLINSPYFQFMDNLLSGMGFKQVSYSKLVLIFLMLECLLQESVQHNVIEQKLVKSIEKIVTHITSKDPALSLIEGITDPLKEELRGVLLEDFDKQSLQQTLNQIKSSKFFRIWQFYCKYRGALKMLFRR